MRYTVVKCESSYELERQVTSYLKQGWKLQGGVSTTSHGMYVYCSQAMIKNESTEEEDEVCWLG